MKRINLVSILLVILGLSMPASSLAYKMNNSYNARYCEFLFADLQGSGLHLTVFNTFGVNNCPQDKWKAINVLQLSKEKGHLAAVANGPRWWIMDQIGGDINVTPEDMGGGLMMRQVATLDIPTTAPPAAYTELTINRTTTWSYNQGRYLRMLTSPSSRQYIMQAYTTMIDPKLTEAKLNTLATARSSKLRLPKGWKYKASKSTKKLDLTIPEHATVIQDNLKNTYQRIK